MYLAQALTNLCEQINQLEETRRQGFLAWLNKHHQTHTPAQRETLLVYLYVWLSGLDQDGQRWELHLLQNEIAWWRDLSVTRLWLFLNKEHYE